MPILPGIATNPEIDMSTTRTILIADDEPAIRLLLEKILAAEGFHVVTAENGAIALRLAARQRFDLVITDLLMPGTDGIETILTLRANSPEIPVIAMSGGWNSGSGSYLPLAGKVGACAMLEKPFSAQVLLDSVRQALGEAVALSA